MYRVSKPIIQQSDHPKVVFPDYADMETFKNMQSTEVYTPDDDRPTRKAKKTENRVSTIFALDLPRSAPTSSFLLTTPEFSSTIS